MSERTDMHLTCCCLVPSALLLKFSPSIFILSTCSWPLPSTRLTAYAGRVKQKGTFKLTTGLFCLSSLIKVQSGWRLHGCSVSYERINVLMDPEKGEEIGKKKLLQSLNCVGLLLAVLYSRSCTNCKMGESSFWNGAMSVWGGFAWQGFDGMGAAGMAFGGHQELPHVRQGPVAAGSTKDTLLARAEPWDVLAEFLGEQI